MLESLNLKNDSLSHIILNANTIWLDVSENHINGIILGDIRMFLPNIWILNLSRNSLDGIIPSSISDLSELGTLDLSEVSSGLFTNLSYIRVLKLSKNRLHGQVLSRNLSLGNHERLSLDNNYFTRKIGNWTIQNNYTQIIKYLHLGSNKFTGSIPNAFRNLAGVLTLDISNNFSLRKKKKNNFIGSIPMQLCQLSNVSLIDLSSNSLFGSIPRCLQNIRTLVYPAFKLSGQDI
ncbi:Leucine-rich repeat-containing protein [Cynara cardunculus var. scolymus]|uniref:Leucine-rich repeat-containing protein n=1 Tax=Cynara cardunculus var. scolymus TaxID=59895 RepID=A0A103STK6_CYNCS|nr:Leucine-rich repeat-containing protein [Cynara cardunculus var. scolymus]